MLLVMMLFGAVLEAVGISALVPFIHFLGDSQVVYKSAWAQKAFEIFNLKSPKEFYVLFSVGLLCFFILKNFYFAVFFRIQNAFLHRKKLALATDLLRSYMACDYLTLIRFNSAELTRNVGYVGRIMDGIWLPLATLLSESMVVILLIGMLFVANPLATLVAVLFVGTGAWLFYSLVQKGISRWASVQFFHSGIMSKALLQSLGGIKEIKIMGKEAYFLETYESNYDKSSQMVRKIQNVNQLPRLFLETLVICGVVGYVLFLLQKDVPLSSAVPILALFAVATARILPSMNRILSSAMAIREGLTNINLLDENLQDLHLGQAASNQRASLPSSAPILFRDKIEIVKVTHAYEGVPRNAVSQVSLDIKKGQAVGFVGSSGAGKSTLIDIILGLIKPQQGAILVDGKDVHTHLRSWQDQIGYVPQNIYLIDDTICRNIAFGIPEDKIDLNRVQEVIRLTQLERLTGPGTLGLQTIVGERGVRISGGERQRIGIARALYHNPQVLILDEATSSLDNETEREITRAIETFRGDKTLIIIAHRLSTVSRCDRLFFMREGALIDSGTYQGLKENNKDFQALTATL